MPRIIFDAFHHMPPGHKIGPHIAVGGYLTNYGRYSPGDVYHPNGLAVLEADLIKEYEIRLLHEPLTDGALHDADILLAMNPDYPLYEGTSPHRWTPDDVDAILRFLDRGGGVLLMVNSFLSRPDHWEENFDIERVSLLFDKLGIRWDANYMSDDKTVERAQSGNYTVGYGQGGRVVGGKPPQGFDPLLNFNGNLYGFIGNVGAGRLAVMGDSGLISNGLMCFPGFDNARFVADLFNRLKPSWCAGPVQSWDICRYNHLSSAPGPHGLTEAIIKGLRPGAAWMVDHHYRHLHWEQDHRSGASGDTWRDLPVDIAALRGRDSARVSLRWLRLDDDEPGPEMALELVVAASAGRYGTDLHAIGRTRSDGLDWAALSRRPEVFNPAGRVEQVHGVFQLDAVLDDADNPRSARWRQGQIIYARNPAAVHYGWEIILSSASGSIAPRA